MWSFTSIVKKGDQQARTFGTPTANLYFPCDEYKDFDSSHIGIYAGFLYLKDKKYNACIYIDILDEKNLKVEGYAINEIIECYGETVTIECHKKVRDKMHFQSLEELKRVIQQDVMCAINILSNVEH